MNLIPKNKKLERAKKSHFQVLAFGVATFVIETQPAQTLPEWQLQDEPGRLSSLKHTKTRALHLDNFPPVLLSVLPQVRWHGQDVDLQHGKQKQNEANPSTRQQHLLMQQEARRGSKTCIILPLSKQKHKLPNHR